MYLKAYIFPHVIVPRHAWKNAQTKVDSGCLWDVGLQGICGVFFMSFSMFFFFNF